MTTSGMEADYDAHSEYQRRVVEGGDKLIRELVAALDLPAAGASGAGTYSAPTRGANPTPARPPGRGGGRGRAADLPVLAVHNDVLTSDFTQLFRTAACSCRASGGPTRWCRPGSG